MPTSLTTLLCRLAVLRACEAAAAAAAFVTVAIGCCFGIDVAIAVGVAGTL